MIFKIRTSVLLLAASLSLSGMAGAGLIARESFDYPIGAVVSADGGAGWDGAWRDSTGATASIAVASGLGQLIRQSPARERTPGSYENPPTHEIRPPRPGADHHARPVSLSSQQ